MNKITNLITAILGLALLTTGCSSVKQIGTVNGLAVTKIVTRDIFAPNTTTVTAHDPNHPGTLEALNEAAGPGLLPATATAAGITAGAVLLRPARTSNSTTTTTSTRVFGNGNSNVTPPPGNSPFIPPGHVNNPSQKN